MSIFVDLSPREVRQAAELAEKRFGTVASEDGDWVDGYTNNGRQQHFIGTLSEFAFSKHYGVQVDAGICSRTDGGVDFRVRIDSDDFADEIVDVDLKGSEADNAELQIAEDSVTADFYVLCRFPDGLPGAETGVTVELVGGATDEMILGQDLRWSPRHEHYNHHYSSKYLHDLPPQENVTPVE